MTRKRAGRPPWMTQEEWEERQAGVDERQRDLYERIKRKKAKSAAVKAERERPRRRRLFGLL